MRKPGDFPSTDASALAKALDPRNKPVVFSLSDAQQRLSRSIYDASLLLEQLEGAGLVIGNGHHMRAKIAEFATNLLKERWINQETKEESNNEEQAAPPSLP